jgi:hypothetical protein
MIRRERQLPVDFGDLCGLLADLRAQELAMHFDKL